MVTHRGFNIGLLYGSESTYGTPVSRATSFGIVTSVSPSISNGNIPVRGNGQGRDVVNIMPGNLDVKLSVTAQVWDFDIFKSAIGPISGGGLVGNKYILTENDRVGNGLIQPLTIEISSDESTDDADVYEGCVMNDFTLSCTVGAPLIATMNFVCENVISSTSATSYSAPSTTPHIFTGGAFKWGASPSTVAKIESVTLTYNNNLNVYRALGNRQIQMPEAMDRDYTFSVVAYMTETIATTLRDDFYGQANSPATGAGGEFTSRLLYLSFSDGASGKNADLTFSGAVIDSMSKPVAGTKDLVKVTFSGRMKSGESNIPFHWWTV